MKEQSEVGTQAEKAVTIVDHEGVHLDANEKAAEVHGCDKGDLIGSNFEDFLAEPSVEHGENFEAMKREPFYVEGVLLERKNGNVVTVSVQTEPTTYNGKDAIKSTLEVIEQPEPGTKTDPGDESLEAEKFDDITPERLEEIVQSIRVEAPSGEMPLNAIMLDLAVGHNELEQYKEGALSLHKAVDERLQEEEERNPDSEECDVLREVKKAAFGLYLRIQRGDAELTGDRDGQYSNYFN